MAHIFRHVYTQKIPQGAEHLMLKGQAAVRWKGRNGKWITGIVCENNSIRCRVESSKWYFEFADHTGKTQRRAGYVDKAATEELCQKLSRTAMRIDAGLLPAEAASPRLPLTELLKRWRNYIESQGASEKGAKRQWQRAKDVCDGIGAIRVKDITPTKVADWIDEKRKADRHKKRFGQSTASNYIGGIKSFTRWCAIVQRCEPTDVLSAIKRSTVRTEMRRDRRALSEEDFRKLLEATKQNQEKIFGLNGVERHALYLLASSTGLRASELASLTTNSFDFHTGTVTIQGKHAKNKRTDQLPVPILVLGAVKKLSPSSGPVWPNRKKPTQAWWLRAAAMVYRDLEAANLPKLVNGKIYDFHCLRGQFATDLDRSGVSLQRAQKLMRHSDPKLTQKHYTKTEMKELAEDVGKLKRGKR
jgi:integrase